MLSPVDCPENISELSNRGSLPIVVEENSLVPTPQDDMPPLGILGNAVASTAAAQTMSVVQELEKGDTEG